MTELELSTQIPETALAECLSASGSVGVLAPYLGVLTPQHLVSQDATRDLDALTTETDALLTSVAVHDLGWLRRISVRGEDRFRWLSGMVTNGVESLADSTGAYNLILNAQGRIQGDCYVWRTGDSLQIELTAEQSEAILSHLDRFIIMDDVELLPFSEPAPAQSTLGVTGPLADQLLAKIGLPALPDQLTSTPGSINGIPVRLVRGYGVLAKHYQLWASAEHIPALWQAMLAAGATPVGAAAIETLRVVEGIPAYGVDIQSRDLAQETSQQRALSFTKGCYLGQEIVERIRSRGQVHRHLRSIELAPAVPGELPAVGTELHLSGGPADAKPVGTLTSVTSLRLNGVQRTLGIGMIRAEAEVGSRSLTYPGGEARILNTALKLTPASNAVEETQ